MSDKPPPPLSAATHTPGWNDPPNLQFNALPTSSTTGGKTKLNLNKRIAFPLQGGPITSKPTAIVQPNQTSAPPLLPMTMPPLAGASVSQHPVAVVHPMPNVNAPPPSQPPTTAAAQTSPLQQRTPPLQEPLPDDAQQFALGILRLQLIKVQETPNVRLDEIQRRIGVMEQLWQSGNLSLPIQAKIYKIAKAVETTSLAEAMETYTSLVLSHSNECSTWAVALRHIILTLQPNNARPQPTIDEQQNTTTSASNSSSPQNATNCVLVPAMPRITNPTDRVNPVQHI